MQNAFSGTRRSHGPVALAVLASSAIVVTSVAAASVLVPIHGLFQHIRTTPAFTAPCTFTNVENGNGILSHLGETAWTSTELGHFDSCPGGVPGGPAITVHGVFTLTAANGDEIQGRYTTFGTLDANGVKVSGPIVFLSGTGRFTNVKGGGVITAVASVLTEASGTIDGVIRY